MIGEPERGLLPEGSCAFFEVYKKANDDFDGWLLAHGYPRSQHAGIPDTSEMLYLGGDQGWVRKELLKDALGDPVPQPRQRENDNQIATTPT
jgi:creatinine amidohydrolase